MTGRHDAIQLLGVQAGIGVHHRHDWRRRGQQARVAGSAVSSLWRVNHLRTVIMGDLSGAVGRAVVDHDRPYPGRHPPQHPAKCLGLVEARQDDVDLRRQRTDHAPTLRSAATAGQRRIAFDSLTPSSTTARRCSRRNARCLG